MLTHFVRRSSFFFRKLSLVDIHITHITRVTRARFLRLLFVIALVASSLPVRGLPASIALFPLQTANAASLPGSTFEIDGNTTVSTGTDWGGTPTSTDLCNSLSDNIHTNSAKEDDVPLPALTTGQPPGKSDLCATYVRSETVGATVYLYIAFDRFGTSGAVTVDYELNQASGVRTVDDRIVVFNLATNGSIDFKYYTWNGTQWIGPTALSASVALAQMSASNTFGEAAINLTGAGFFPSNPSACRSFISVTTRTRSSDSISASLQDYIVPVIIPTLSNCPDVSVSKTDNKTQIDAGSPNSYTIVISNVGPVTATNASVNDTLPAALTSVTWACTAVSPNACSTSAMTVTIRPGSTVTFTLNGTVSNSASGILTNTVVVTGTPLLLDANPGNNTAIDTTALRQPDVTISKAATPNPATAGSLITYTLAVTNIGAAPANNVTISDTLPAGLTFQSYSNAPPSTLCSGTVLITCSAGTLAPNASTSIQIVALVGANVLSGTQLINTATVTTTSVESSNANNQASVTTPVIRIADLSIAKTHSAPVIAGMKITYTLTVGNLGPSAVSAAIVNDTVPASISGVSWTCLASAGSACNAGPVLSGTLNDSVNILVGGQLIYTVVGTLAAGASGQLQNVASVTAPNTVRDPILANNIATDTVSIITQANLSIAKSGPAVVIPGQTATYVITLTNAGPSDAPNATVSDPAPAGLTLIDVTGAGCAALPCNTGMLLAGQTRTLTVTFAVPSGYLTPNPFVNTASLTSSNHLTPETASATTSVTPNADLAISKGSPLTAAIPGTQVHFTVTVVNNGPSDAQNVVVQDPTPAGLTSPLTTDPPCAGAALPCNLGTLVAGQSKQFIVTYTVPPDYSGLDLTNVATVTAATPDAIGSNNVATSTLPNTPLADLSISKFGPVTVLAGNALTYTILVTNNGPSDAQGVVVADPGQSYLIWQQTSGDCVTAFPCNLGTLAAGATRSIQVRFLVPSSFPAPGPVTNIVTATSPTDPTPNSASATTDVQALSTLTLTKSGPASAIPGTTVIYTIMVTNSGPSDAQNVVVDDPTPVGLTLVSNSGDCVVAYPCTFASLPVGGTRTIVSTFAVPADYAVSSITNIVTATALFSANPVSATTITPVTPQADLEITKRAEPNPVVAGTALTYTLTITNHGPSDASGVVVTDVLPAGVSLVTVGGAGWNCVPNNPINCTRATLASGAVAAIQIVVSVNPGATGSLTNSTGIASGTADPNASNNYDQVVTSIQVETNINISKEGPATATPGTVINYSIHVTNTGASNALNVLVSETVPAFTTFTGSGWACAPNANSGSVCTQTIAVLAGGSSATLPFQVTVVNPLPAGASQFDNVVLAGGPNLTTTLPYTVHTDLVYVQGLTLSKDDGGVSAAPGGIVTYTLRYTNTGNIALSAVIIQETVPDHSTFVGPATWQGCASGAGAGTLCTINLGIVAGAGAAGSAGTLQFAVRVDNPLPVGVNQLQNFASITSQEDVSATATDTTPLNTFINLQLSKSADVASTVPGGFINYTLRYTNTGNIEVVNVPLSEIVPDNTVYVGNGWTCAPDNTAGSSCTRTIASIAGGGGNGQVTFVVQVNSTVPANTQSINNTAVLNGSINATTSTPLVVLTGIALSKDDAGISAVPSALITYTVRYTNTGNTGLTGVALAEVVPLNTTFAGPGSWSCPINSVAGTACTQAIGALAAQASGSVLFVVRVNNPLSAGVTEVNNTVIATSNESAGGSAGDVTPLITSINLAINKTDAGITARPGDTVVYTLTYSNAGNIAAANVTVTETVPPNSTFSSAGSSAGWSCANNAPTGSVCRFNAGTLAGGGAGGTVRFAIHIDTPLPASVTQVNNAVLIGANGSPNVGANDNTPLQTFSDVRVSKTDGDVHVTPGNTVVYTLTYVNVGDIAATGVIVTETVPGHSVFVASASSVGWGCADGAAAGTICAFNLGTLAGGGASGILKFAVRLDALLPAGVTQILNGAFIGSNEGPGTAGSDTTPVDAATNIGITKSDGNVTALPGGVVIYTLTARNNGNIGAASVVMTETVPANTTFVAGSSSVGWSCVDGAGAGTVCALDIGALAGGGATAGRSFAVRLANPMPAGVSSITNTVRVAEVGQPPRPPAIEVTPVDVHASIRVIKTASNNAVTVGGRLTYTIQVFNDGPGVLINAVMSDVLPSGLLFQSLVTPAGWTCSTPAVGASGVVRCARALFEPGNASFTIVAQTVATLAGGTVLSNTAVLAGSTPDNAPIVNSPPVITVVEAPLLVVRKVALPTNGQRVRFNDLITYTLTITNLGNATATNVRLSDAIPTKTQYVPGSGVPVIAGGPSPLRWNLGTLNAGESRSVRFTVLVTETDANASSVTAIDNIGSGVSDQTPVTTSNHIVHPFDPTAIHLLQFTAKRVSDGVLVQWTTDLEIDTFGFHLYRSSDDQRSSAVRVTPTLIAALGRNAGASYEFVDTTAKPGQAYAYWLQEVELDGDLIDYGPTLLPGIGAVKIRLPLIAKH